MNLGYGAYSALSATDPVADFWLDLVKFGQLSFRVVGFKAILSTLGGSALRFAHLLKGSPASELSPTFSAITADSITMELVVILARQSKVLAMFPEIIANLLYHFCMHPAKMIAIQMKAFFTGKPTF